MLRAARPQTNHLETLALELLVLDQVARQWQEVCFQTVLLSLLLTENQENPSLLVKEEEAKSLEGKDQRERSVKFTDPTGLIVLRGSNGVTYNTNYDGSHVWPTESHRLTNHMDPVIHPKGIDVGASVQSVKGDPVVATVGGKVTTSGFPEWSDSDSSYVIVMGEDGLEHRYAHMSGLRVEEGDTVKQGQQLGDIDPRNIGPDRLKFATIFGGSVGLQVIHVDMTRTARQCA